MSRRRTLTPPFSINAWPSFSDALASGLLILVFIITLLSIFSGKVLDEIEERQRATEFEEEMVRQFEQTIEDQGMSVEREGTVLRIRLPEQVLFDSGRADSNPDGREVLRILGLQLESFGYDRVLVEGHTDDQPIRETLQGRYETNWELSTGRACRVARFLIEASGLAEESFVASGYAEFHPVAGNDTEEGRAENRRIEIVVHP